MITKIFVAKNIFKYLKYFLLVLVLQFSAVGIAAKNNVGTKNSKSLSINITAKNNLDKERNDVLVSIPMDKLIKKYPGLNKKTFTAFDNNIEIPTQLEDYNGDGIHDNVLFLVNFAPHETKTITIKFDKSTLAKKEFRKRTQAILATKFNYTLRDGYYTGGEFRNISKLEMPQDHFAHDALIKFEGPGWESDKVAYRFYLDSRNRNDIFAKKVDDVVLQNVGNNDLVSDSKESYTKMCDWGMDVFKVGESLGIGSIGMWEENKVNTVSKTDKVICKITDDGIIKSNILTNYKGWIVGTQKYDLKSLLSISAGSRLTKEEITILPNPENICTGLAKHADCDLIKDENKLGWGYIASYGKQSLAGDNLGIAVFYKKSDLIKLTEDAVSFITILKPSKGKVTYYFAAASEMELNGIKSKDEFMKYLDGVILELSNPIVAELR